MIIGRIILNFARKIENKQAVSPHKLRHTYAIKLLNTGTKLVNIKALLGYESITTPQLGASLGQEMRASCYPEGGQHDASTQKTRHFRQSMGITGFQTKYGHHWSRICRGARAYEAV